MVEEIKKDTITHKYPNVAIGNSSKIIDFGTFLPIEDSEGEEFLMYIRKQYSLEDFDRLFNNSTHEVMEEIEKVGDRVDIEGLKESERLVIYKEV